jgi:hypothetical protein
MSTRTTVRRATQDRRSGNPGKKWPGIGTKPDRGDATHSLPGGEGVATSTVSGTSPPARRDDPSTTTSAPHIARQGDTCGVCSPAICTHVSSADRRATVRIRGGGDSVSMLGGGRRNCGDTGC